MLGPVKDQRKRKTHPTASKISQSCDQGHSLNRLGSEDFEGKRAVGGGGASGWKCGWGAAAGQPRWRHRGSPGLSPQGSPQQGEGQAGSQGAGLPTGQCSLGIAITSLRDVTTSAVLLTSELMRKTLLRCPLAFWTPGPTMHTVGWQVRPQGVWLGRGQG